MKKSPRGDSSTRCSARCSRGWTWWTRSGPSPRGASRCSRTFPGRPSRCSRRRWAKNRKKRPASGGGQAGRGALVRGESFRGLLLIPRCRRVGRAARKGDPPPGAGSVRAQENLPLLDPFLAGPLGLDPQTLSLYVYSIRLCHLVSIDRTGDPSTQLRSRVPFPKNGDVPSKKSSPSTAGATSACTVTRRHSRLPHPRRGLLASSLDLRCTRKSALDLPPGKLRSDPPSF